MSVNLASVGFAVLLAATQMPRIKFVIERDTLVTSDKGYVLGAPIHVAGPGQFALRWSPDGKYLAAVSQQIAGNDRFRAVMGQQVPSTSSIYVWDGKSGRTVNVLTSSDAHALFISGWMSDASLYYLQEQTLPSGPQRNEPEFQYSIHRWRPGQTGSTQVYSSKNALMLRVSSKQPYGLLEEVTLARRPTAATAAGVPVEVPTVQKKVLLVTPGGVKPLESPPADASYTDKEGFFCALTLKMVGAGVARQRVEEWKRLSLNGVWETVSSEPEIDETADSSFGEGTPAVDPNGLQTILSRTEARQGPVQARMQSAWLWAPVKGVIHAALVNADTTLLSLSPTKENIAYVSQEHLMIRPIQIMSAADLDKMLETAERQELMDQAKQVGLGMMIYGADADDSLPLSAGWQDALLPYLKSKNLLDGFVYELNGDNLGKLEDPASKRLGYVSGSRGRAIVFADGHVIWDNKRQP